MHVCSAFDGSLEGAMSVFSYIHALHTCQVSQRTTDNCYLLLLNFCNNNVSVILESIRAVKEAQFSSEGHF